MKNIVIPEALRKLAGGMKKYQYVLLVVLIGIALLLVPGKDSGSAHPEKQSVPVEETLHPGVEARMEELLSQVDGAGRIRVMLTVRAGEYTRYQTDTVTQSRSHGEEESVEITTVFAESGSGEEAIPVQVMGPEYLGALIVAEGADLASVRLDLVNAVSSLTGLGADKITVVKMKHD